MRLLLLSVFLFSVLAGCKTDNSDSEPPEYLLDQDAYTALQALWEPLIPSAQTQELMDLGDFKVTELDRFKDEGLGVRLAEGIPWIEHLELAPGFSAGDPAERRSLLYLWQAADPQLIGRARLACTH